MEFMLVGVNDKCKYCGATEAINLNFSEACHVR
jgi:hypothetical protein